MGFENIMENGEIAQYEQIIHYGEIAQYEQMLKSHTI